MRLRRTDWARPLPDRFIIISTINIFLQILSVLSVLVLVITRVNSDLIEIISGNIGKVDIDTKSF